MPKAPSSISGGSQVLPDGSLNSGAKLEGKGTFVTPSGKRSVKLRDGGPKVGRKNIREPAGSASKKARTVSAVEDQSLNDKKSGDDSQLLLDMQEDSPTTDDRVSEWLEATTSSSGMDDQKTRYQDQIDDFEEVERYSTSSGDSGYSDSFPIQDDPEDQDITLDDDAALLKNIQKDSPTADDSVSVLSEATTPSTIVDDGLVLPPSEQFPALIKPKTAGTSITISGGNGVDTQDASITIEGGSKIGEQTVWGTIKDGLKKLWSLAVDFASNHKIAIGLALSILLVFIMASPAGPGIVGGLFGAALITSLGASIACAFFGALIVDMIGGIGPYADQVPPQSNTQNQQSNQKKDDSTSDKSDKSKTVSDSQQNSETAVDSKGSFFLTPKEKMAAGDGNVRALSTDAAVGQHEKEFTLKAFNTWLDQNFGRWTNKAQYAEFSKTLRGSDNYGYLKAEDKLDKYLGVLSQKRLDLSVISGAPLKEGDGSGDRQSYRLYDFKRTLKSALAMLNPSASHCEKMYIDLLRILPKDEFPYVSSNVDSPLLSDSVDRESLEALSREEMAKLEASDFIGLTLRILRAFAKRQEGKVQPVKRKGRIDLLDGESPEKIRKRPKG